MIAFANPVMDKTTMKLLTNIRNACVLKCTAPITTASANSAEDRFAIVSIVFLFVIYLNNV